MLLKESHQLKNREYSAACSTYANGFGFSMESIKSLLRCKTMLDHNGCVNTFRWSKSGDRIITGSDDRTLKIWDTKDFNSIQLCQTISEALTN